MTIQMDISRLNRAVLIVARGPITYEEILSKTAELKQLDVARYGKVIDIFGVTTELTRGQVRRIAASLRKDPDSQGPVAFVIDPERKGPAHAFADVLKCDRLVRLFRSLHDARKWVGEASQAVRG